MNDYQFSLSRMNCHNPFNLFFTDFCMAHPRANCVESWYFFSFSIQAGYANKDLTSAPKRKRTASVVLWTILFLIYFVVFAFS